MQPPIPVITIDGPGGSGKGTIGQLLAKELGWHFLDSGILYRVLALASEYHAILPDNEDALALLANALDVYFRVDESGISLQVMLEGQDVTEAIRAEACGSRASTISVWPKVREALLTRQRAFRQPPGLVTDGRDMGTVVFPDAQLKFFLQASSEERARRRYEQLKKKGINVSLAALYAELAERDRRDEGRVIAPLRPAADAIILDTTSLSVEQVLQKVREVVRTVFR